MLKPCAAHHIQNECSSVQTRLLYGSQEGQFIHSPPSQSTRHVGQHVSNMSEETVQHNKLKKK